MRITYTAAIAIILAACFAVARLAVAQDATADSAARTVILQTAPSDKAVSIPLEKLKGYYSEMDSRKLQTLRMLEGGRYSVNVRRITNAETALVHEVTTDIWVVTEGSGTLTTGGKIEKGRIAGGESHTIKAGDVEFIPPGVSHGISGVSGSITWLNIRFDTNYK